ncbi:MAG: glycosyltransferase [Pseudidiomarina maritima]|nr:glycosyltransferase [Pseudidiomarina maritima]
MVRKLKILFIAHNNRQGGALQNILNFCGQALSDNRNQFHFVLPSNAKGHLIRHFPIDTNRINFIEPNISIIQINKLVREIELVFKPDVVYTMAGPNYIARGKVTVVQGVSDAFITHAPISAYFKNRSLLNGFLFFLLRLFKGLVLRSSADKIVFQTSSARSGYCRKFLMPMNNTYVIPNAINPWFLDVVKGMDSRMFLEKNDETVIDSFKVIKVLVPAVDYPHKNIQFIKKILECDSFPYRVEFILTLPDTSFVLESLLKYNSLERKVINIGPFLPDEAPSIYLNADIVFLPSVCETFSTSYIEAIALHKPLIVPDFSFSREVCADYAEYYRSDDVEDFIRAFQNVLIEDKVGRFSKASKILEEYGGQDLRYKRIIAALQDSIAKV